MPHFASKSGVAIANCASLCALAAIHGNVAHSCGMRNRKEKSQRKCEVRRSMHPIMGMRVRNSVFPDRPQETSCTCCMHPLRRECCRLAFSSESFQWLLVSLHGIQIRRALTPPRLTGTRMSRCLLHSNIPFQIGNSKHEKRAQKYLSSNFLLQIAGCDNKLSRPWTPGHVFQDRESSSK